MRSIIWKNSFSENEVKVSEHILELIGRRDSLEPWILNRVEIQDIIDMLATM